MYIVIVMFFICILVSLIMSCLGGVAMKRGIIDRRKSSAFECGFLVKNLGHVYFSLRFFLIAVVFLIFDVEISLLLMSPVVREYGKLVYYISVFVLFILILLWGLYLEWYKGILMWAVWVYSL